MADVAKLVISVDTDATAAIRRLDDLDARIRRLSGQTVNIRVNADTAKATEQLDRLARDRTVNIHADTNNLRRDIDGAIGDLGRLGSSGDSAGRALSGGANAASTGFLGMSSTVWIAIGAVLALGPAASLASGVILATLPVAFIALGAIALKNNDLVKSSFKDMTSSIQDTMARAAQPMIKPLVDGMHQLAQIVKDLEPAFRQAFAAAGQAIKPLVEGIGALVKNAMPGIIEALKAIGPVMDGLKQGLAHLGTGLSLFFEGLSQGAAGAGKALNDTLSRLGELLQIIGHGFGALAGVAEPVLNALLIAVNVIVQGLLQGLVPAFQAMAGPLSLFIQNVGFLIGELLSQLLPVLGQLIAALTSAFVPVLQACLPLVSTFAQFLGGLVTALTPIITAVGQLAAALLTALKPILDAIVPLIVNLAQVIGATLASAITTLTPVLTSLITALGTILQPILNVLPSLVQTIASAFLQLLAALAPIITQLVSALVPILTQLVTIIATNLNVILPVLIGLFMQVLNAILPILPALIPVVAQLLQLATNVLAVLLPLLAQLVQIIGTALSAALSVVLPIIVELARILISVLGAAITALQAILQGLATAWSAIWTAIKAVAEAVWTALQAGFQAFVGVLRALWDAAGQAIKDAWKVIWDDNIRPIALAVWNILQTAWSAFVSAVKAIWDAISGPLATAWNVTWTGIRTVGEAIWQAIQNAWHNVTDAIKAIWDAISGPLSAAWNAVWTAIKAVGQGIWDAMQAAWHTVTDAIKAIWDAISGPLQAVWSACWSAIKAFVEPLWDGLKNAWNSAVSAIKKIWDDVSEPLKKAFNATWNAVKSTAETIWNGIKKTVGDAVNVVIDIINGIIGAWDAVVNAVGLKALNINKIDHVKFADGGHVQGAGTGTSDSIPAMLSNGEYVIKASAVQKYGVTTLNHINAGRYATGGLVQKFVNGGPVGGGGNPPLDGGDVPAGTNTGPNGGGNGNPLSNAPGSNDAPGTKDDPAGGVADAVANVAKTAAGWVLGSIGAAAIKAVFTPFNKMLDVAEGHAGNFGKIVAKGTHRVEDGLIDLLTKKDEAAHTTSVAGGTYSSALEWAKSQVGKPYQWGGNGDPSWDCSGFMSAIESVIRGESPHRRWATMAFSGDTAPDGWKHNAESPFKIGITNAGVGHTAGTLNGTNVECRGGDGCLVGGSARGFNDPLFPDWYGFTAVKPVSMGAIPAGDHLNVIDQALKAAGVPPPGTQQEWEAGLNTLIERESGWNASAVNNTDSNAANGQPSQGLAQVIPATFAAYHVAGTANDILDPVANVAAAIRYIVSVYGNISAVQQANPNAAPAGYWMGTNSAQRGWARIAEMGGEWMQDKGQWHYFSGGEKVLPHGTSPSVGSSGHHISVQFDNGSIQITVPEGNAADIAENLGDELATSIKMAIIAGVGG